MGRVSSEVEDLLQLGSRRMANIHTTRLLTHPRTLHFDSPGIGTVPFRRFRLGGGDLLDLPVRPAQVPPSQLLLLQHSGPLCSISRLDLFWGACLLERVSQSRLFGDWNGVLLYDNVILILNIYTGRRVALSHHDVYHTPQWYLFLFILHPVPLNAEQQISC